MALRTAGDLASADALLKAQAKPMFIEWLAAINVFIDLEEAMNQLQDQFDLTAEDLNLDLGPLGTLLEPNDTTNTRRGNG